MYTKFIANININGSGAVVAAPDHNTPGGSYYYHWMRDGALTMYSFMEINDFDYSSVQENMNAYQNWVGTVQKKSDPNNIDVRTEPKFTISDANPYDGKWCRPQNDGPALRALSLSKWGEILVKNSKQDQAKNTVWPLI
jgi:glucoamylase